MRIPLWGFQVILLRESRGLRNFLRIGPPAGRGGAAKSLKLREPLSVGTRKNIFSWQTVIQHRFAAFPNDFGNLAPYGRFPLLGGTL